MHYSALHSMIVCVELKISLENLKYRQFPRIYNRIYLLVYNFGYIRVSIDSYWVGVTPCECRNIIMDSKLCTPSTTLYNKLRSNITSPPFSLIQEPQQSFPPSHGKIQIHIPEERNQNFIKYMIIIIFEGKKG